MSKFQINGIVPVIPTPFGPEEEIDWAFGDIGKNSLRGPRFSNTDLALIKKTAVGEHVTVTCRAEFLNAFNHPNFGLPGNNVAAGPPPSGGFGVISGTAGSQSYNSTTYGMAQPRIMQFGLKVSF